MLALVASTTLGLPSPTDCAIGQVKCSTDHPTHQYRCYSLSRNGSHATSWLPGMHNDTLKCSPCSRYNVWDEGEGCVYDRACSTGPPCVVRWQSQSSPREAWEIRRAK